MFDHTVLQQLIQNEEYARGVLPHLRLSYFGERVEKIIFRTFVEYHQKYNASPGVRELVHEVGERTDLNDDEFDSAVHLLESFTNNEQDEKVNFKWLMDTTEEWCQERALHNAIMKSISIIDGDDEKNTKHSIPEMIKDALAVSFRTDIGHDYLADADKRFEFYNQDHPRIPFDLKMLNKVTNGGCPRKTLNIILAGTNVGKTLAMVHMAASYLKQGLNVLYVTMEMAEEWIANRIDANMMDRTLTEVESLQKPIFDKEMEKIRKEAGEGRLIIKEFPTASAHAGHIRQTLDELKLKKKFEPDVIFVDYIGITASSRVKLGQTGSYFYVKAVAEELRGLAAETETVLWSAVQVNRGGFNASDMDLTDTAESFGLPATADFMIGVSRTDELDALGQLLIKQLKSRYGNKNHYNKFVLGVDPDKMQLFDVEQSAQEGIIQETTTPDPKPDKRSRFSGIEA